MRGRAICVGLTLLAVPWTGAAQPTPPRLHVFLDCESCFIDFLREEIGFVDFVRDRVWADVHVIITDAETSAAGREFSAAFIGNGRLASLGRTLRTVAGAADSDDIVRRQVASMVRIGLLNFVAADTVPSDLAVAVAIDGATAQRASPRDRWNSWVFSLRGSASFEGEESQRQIEASGAVSGDRITPNWKLSLGVELEREHDRFNLDEGGRLVATRRDDEFRWLAVKALHEHWSAGVEGAVASSTFENVKVAYEAAPAIEFNVFPYSQYTRRQLRLQYAVGVRHARYNEVSVYGRSSDVHPVHESSAAFEQIEPWGSLDVRLQWSQYLHNRSLSRLEAEGLVSWRLARGFSLALEGSASRVRDQISLPRRGATDEEVLLELRRLRSGYEYELSIGVTYTFGSIYSAIVNPRFGQ